jgi:alpha-tubulin suppressor-like RCC1 family protein
MRNVARPAPRPALRLALVTVLGLAAFGVSAAACWPLAPVGGTIDDDGGAGVASDGGVLTTDSGTPALDGSPTATDGEAGAQEGGDGSSGDGSPTAVDAAVPGPLGVATGVGFGCYVDGYGFVWCWGNNEYWQTGSAVSHAPVVTPQKVSQLSGIVAVAVGDSHACALSATGAVSCWGLNAAYQLGHTPSTMNDTICIGTAPNMTVACNPAPVAVALSATPTSIQASGARTCVTANDGSVQCWGAVQDAVDYDASTVSCGSGDSPSGGTCYASPHAIGGVSGAVQVGVGFDHDCSLADAGALTCWGYDEEGEVSSNGCLGNDCPPTAVASLTGTAALGLGNETTCALDGSGVVRCFGDNVYGQLGHPPGADNDPDPDAGAGVFNLTPQEVTGITGVTALVGAPEAACVLANATVVCWGNVRFGAMPGIPVAVPGVPALSALGEIDATYACGIAPSGAIWCWDLLLGGAAPLPSPTEGTSDGGSSDAASDGAGNSDAGTEGDAADSGNGSDASGD